MMTSNRISSPLADLQNDLENMFGHWMGDRGAGPERTYSPRTNVTETDTAFLIHVELPGVAHDDVTVEVADNRLTISGEKQIPDPEEGAKVLRAERFAGPFKRRFEFSKQVDFDRIEATFEAGVLTVDVPKSEKVLPRKVKVKVNQ